MKQLGVVLTSALFAAGMAVAQSDAPATSRHQATKKSTPMEETKTETRQTPSAKTRIKAVIVEGKVTKYDPGKTLEVSTPKNRHRKFDLDDKNTTVNGAENVKVGDMVKVTQRVENGKKVIDIAPYTAASNTTPSTDNAGSATSRHSKSPKKY